jgi:alpha-methylacyl-CoA racemase
MGPLEGLKIIEIAGIGPGPFCAMMLADMGAEIVRIDRKGAAGSGTKADILNRGRRSIALDLKTTEGIEAVLKLIEQADALIEGFRPGVMERLGLGPEVCQQRNAKLVYGRMTGWGQYGPLAQTAGHDINYIALTGALHSVGQRGRAPVPPVNLVGDFGGGGMMLAYGLVCGLLEARTSGQGQVVDAAMTDGSAALMAMTYGFKAKGMWTNERGSNLLDGGAHFYDTYECADSKWVAIGPVEPQFYSLLLELCGLDDPDFEDQRNPSKWPELKTKFAIVFKTKSRDEWSAIMEGTDACLTPILDLDEAPLHPHNQVRKTFVELDGVMQPAPAPRFSRTVPEIQGPPPVAGEHTDAILEKWGFSSTEIAQLKECDAI